MTDGNGASLTSYRGAVDLWRYPGRAGQEVWALADLSDVSAKKGNSTIVQMQTGSTATNDCAKFDANGNIVSAGAPCGGANNPGGSGTEVQFRGGASTFSPASNFDIQNNNPHLVSSAAPGRPNNGEFWYDSTQKTEAFRIEGLTTYRSGVIFVATAAKTTANTTALTTIFGTGVGTLTLPANFAVAGRVVRIKCGGIYSTDTTGRTISFTMKFGATTIMTGGFAAGTATDAASNGELGRGVHDGLAVDNNCRGAGHRPNSQQHRDRGNECMGIDFADGSHHRCTTAQALDVQSSWSAANASNSITTNWSTVEVLN